MSTDRPGLKEALKQAECQQHQSQQQHHLDQIAQAQAHRMHELQNMVHSAFIAFSAPATGWLGSEQEQEALLRQVHVAQQQLLHQQHCHRWQYQLHLQWLHHFQLAQHKAALLVQPARATANAKQQVFCSGSNEQQQLEGKSAMRLTMREWWAQVPSQVRDVSVTNTQHRRDSVDRDPPPIQVQVDVRNGAFGRSFTVKLLVAVLLPILLSAAAVCLELVAEGVA